MSTVLITGGAGFVGSQLAYYFHRRGDEVFLVDDMSYGKEDNLTFDGVDFKSKLFKCDITNYEALQNVFDKVRPRYVYNIAGIAPLPDCQSNPGRAVEVNTVGFVNVLNLSKIYGIQTVVQASTNAIYENEQSFPVTEDFKTKPTLIYPNTKYCAEQFARSFADTYGMNVCCLRFANVYGPHCDCLRKQPPFVAYMIRELHYNRTPIFHSDGNQRRDYIFVDDLAELAYKVRSCKGFDAVNVSSNTNYSVNEMYKLAQKIMKKDIPASFAEDSHYWEKYSLGDIKPEILNHEINKLTLCDNKHAFDYGWEPKVSMEQGLKIMIDETVKYLNSVNI